MILVKRVTTATGAYVFASTELKRVFRRVLIGYKSQENNKKKKE